MQLNWNYTPQLLPIPCYRQCEPMFHSGLHFTHGLLLHRYSKLTIAYNGLRVCEGAEFNND